jgi:hypothetical protein
MVNSPQDDLFDLVRQQYLQYENGAGPAIHIEHVDTIQRDCEETFKLCVYVSGHKLWNVGLNPKHDTTHCAECKRSR